MILKKLYRALISSTVLCIIIYSSQAYAVDVCGHITQDTTWTLFDSPYIVTCNVTIRQGVTLTIEPGVEVKFDGDFGIYNSGNFDAQGTPDKKIRFTSNLPNPMKDSWAFLGLTNSYSSNSTVRYCIVEYAWRGLYATLKEVPVIIDNNELYHNVAGIYVLRDATPTITNNTIKYNTYGIGVENDSDLYNIAQAIISGNIIRENQKGVVIDGRVKPALTHNIISDNDTGIILRSTFLDTPTQTVIKNNQIFDNQYNLTVYVFPFTVDISNEIFDATENWWGTTDYNIISETIYDNEDNPKYAVVNYVPYLDGPEGNPMYPCGDGYVDPGEQCDDGNKLELDGCDEFCQIETDMDSDGVYDKIDNCSVAPNGPNELSNQIDTDFDGYGNACDADYDNNGIVEGLDRGLFNRAQKTVLGDRKYNPDLDSNGNNIIDQDDLDLFHSQIGFPPGPSGLSCAGTIPCP